MKNLFPRSSNSWFLIYNLFLQKKNGPAPAPAVVGKWTIVSDTYLSGLESLTDTTMVKVQPSDYIDFDASGKLYINENSTDWHDTLYYSLVTDTLNVKTYNIYHIQNNVKLTYDYWNISGLTNHTMAIEFGGADPGSPEGIYDERIHLKK